MVRDKRFIIIYRILLLILTIIGLYLNIRGRGISHSIIYFTVQSNFLVLFMTIYLLVETRLTLKRYWVINTLKGAIMISIMITFLVFHFLLRNMLIESGYSQYVYSISSYLLHYIVPILYLGDWVLIDEKGKFTKKDPLYWLVIPYLYMVFAFVRAELFGVIDGTTSRYPYFFIDIDLLGFEVIFYVIPITIFFIVFSYGIIVIDFKLKNKD